MNVLDVNVLIYAYAADSPVHDAVRTWLQAQIASRRPLGLPWVTAFGFCRISTDLRAFARPLTALDAFAVVEGLLGCPGVSVTEPAPGHWPLVSRLVQEARIAGPHVADAHLAALAIERGATLCTTDRSFARFPALKTFDPTVVR